METKINAGDVLSFLLPEGGWAIVGEDFDNIQWLDETKPRCTKAEFDAGYAQYNSWKSEQDARVLTPAEKLFNATGLTVAEYKALGL
jgi:hypothetical protein